MHPAIAIELAAARQAELLHAVDSRRTPHLGSARRPVHRSALTTLSRSAAATTRRLRQRVAQLVALAARPQSPLQPCC